MASVTLEEISKSYRGRRGELRAVDRLSLHVADREFVVLVGPSGCGKTTTLRLIAGLDALDGGTVRIGDRVVNRVEPRHRDVAMVFQNYALYPHMTVRKNMAFGLKMRRVPRPDIERKIADAAAKLGIEHLLDRKPASLSGGEQQRVALGRAIVRTPNVFLLDEPLSNLDARLRVQMRTELKTLHHDLNATILHVTHDQEEAMTLGDRIAVLKDGVLQQCGAPLDIYHRPANRFVAGFIGTPPMNLVAGRIEIDGSAALFTSSVGHVTLTATPAVRAEHGREVILGVRPEHLELSLDPVAPGVIARDSSHGNRPALAPLNEMPVLLVEPLGNATNVHLTSHSGQRLTARVPPDVTIAPGQTVTPSVDPSRCHLFAADPEGRRIDCTGP